MIVTDQEWRDSFALTGYALDLAFGSGENDFELTCPERVEPGALAYIDGTEYGGIVDGETGASDSEVATYRGRTWHGMLAAKVLCPDPGSDYYELFGTPEQKIAAVIERCGLGGVFAARAGAGSASRWRFERFADAYTGLRKRLAEEGLRLAMSREGGRTLVWAEPVRTVGDAVDSDLLRFEATSVRRCVNHLVCAGEGELASRAVVHLYADAKGLVSKTQTLFGADEIAALYDYRGADAAELESEGAKKLRELQTAGGVEVTDVDGSVEAAVGDVVAARDNRNGRSVSAEVTKVIVRASDGSLSVSYEVGGASSQQSGAPSVQGGGVSYTGGRGIQISGGVVSSDLEIGSENMLRGTNRGSSGWWGSWGDGAGSISEAVAPDGSRGVRLSCSRKSGTWFYMAFSVGAAAPELNAIKRGDPVTVGFSAKASAPVPLFLSLQHGNGTNRLVEKSASGQAIGAEAVRYAFTFERSAVQATSESVVFFSVPLEAGADVVVWGLKLAGGEVDTGWSPSPYDQPPAVQSGVVSIVQKAVGEPASVYVAFPAPFAKSPNVVVSALTSVPHKVSVSASNLSAKGFSAYLCRTDALVETSVEWVATVQ